MKFYEKISIRLYQKFPEWIFPQSFKDWCMAVAEKELASTKQEIIRKRWEQAKLEGQLSNLKNIK